MSQKVVTGFDLNGLVFAAGYSINKYYLADAPSMEDIADVKNQSEQKYALLDAQKVGKPELEKALTKSSQQIDRVEARIQAYDSSIKKVSLRVEKLHADLTQKIASGGPLEQIFRAVSDAQILRIDKRTDEFRKEVTALIKSAADANRAACEIRDAVKVSQDHIVALHSELSKIAQIKEYAKCAEHFQSLAKINADEALCVRDSLEAELTAVRKSNEDLVGDNRTLRKHLTFVMSVGAAAVVLLGVGNAYVLTRMPAPLPRSNVVPQALQMPAVPASEAKPAAAMSGTSTNSAGAPAKAQQPAVTQPQESPTTWKPASSSSAGANPASQTASSEKHDG